MSFRTLSAYVRGHLFSMSWNVCICVCFINVCRPVFANSFLSHQPFSYRSNSCQSVCLYLPLYPVSPSTTFVFQSIPCDITFRFTFIILLSIISAFLYFFICLIERTVFVICIQIVYVFLSVLTYTQEYHNRNPQLGTQYSDWKLYLFSQYFETNYEYYFETSLAYGPSELTGRNVFFLKLIKINCSIVFANLIKLSYYKISLLSELNVKVSSRQLKSDS